MPLFSDDTAIQLAHLTSEASDEDKLELSESTVITYKKRAFGKLKINRKSELVRFV